MVFYDHIHLIYIRLFYYFQVDRLHQVMDEGVPIHGRGNFPTLDIKLKDLVTLVREKLRQDGIHVKDIRLNGGAASYILGCETNQCYNDLDLIFGLDHNVSQNDLQKVKAAVLNSLLNFLPEGVNKEKMSSCSLKEAYVSKMVKVSQQIYYIKWHFKHKYATISLICIIILCAGVYISTVCF